MDEQCVSFFVRFLWSGQTATLTAVLCVLDRVLARNLCDAKPLKTHAKARCVHHDEHGGEALRLLADEIAGRAVIIHDAGRIGVNAHLVLDRPAGDAIARAKAAIVIDEELRHDEQADTLHIVGRAGCLGQHQMNDVLGQVMLARRNEDFRPRH